MPTSNDPKDAQQAPQAPEAASGPDMGSVLATLNQVFSTFRAQLQDEAPEPFDGAAKVAVDTFNDIVAGLKFRSLPAAPEIAAKPISSTEIELTWTDDTLNADGYRVRRCQGQDCTDSSRSGSSHPPRARSGMRILRPHHLSVPAGRLQSPRRDALGPCHGHDEGHRGSQLGRPCHVPNLAAGATTAGFANAPARLVSLHPAELTALLELVWNFRINDPGPPASHRSPGPPKRHARTVHPGDALAGAGGERARQRRRGSSPYR